MLQSVKKGDVNWFLILAIIGITALIIILLMTGGIFQKWFGTIFGFSAGAEVEKECAAGFADVDADNDGYKDVGTANIEVKKGKFCIYTCDPDPKKPGRFKCN